MFECNGQLRTWAIDCEPTSAHGVKALQLPDHRVAYLDYEGPVSHDRGSVTRWDAGNYEVQDSGPDMWKLALRGARLAGSMTLWREAPESHSWRVSLVAAPILD